MTPMDFFSLNLNDTIRVKLTDPGIEYYVRNFNAVMPFRFQISFSEYKERADKDGYHSYQVHDFMDCFGRLGMGLASYVNLNILIPKSNLKDLEAQ